MCFFLWRMLDFPLEALALGTFDDRSLDPANFSMIALLTLRTFVHRLPMQIQSLLYIGSYMYMM